MESKIYYTKKIFTKKTGKMKLGTRPIASDKRITLHTPRSGHDFEYKQLDYTYEINLAS